MVRIIAICVLLAVAACPSSAADNVLSLGEPVSGTLAEGAKNKYRADFEAGTFVYAEINQLNFDAKVTVIGPDGSVAGNFDYLARGWDAIQFETESTGSYTFQVEGFEGGSGDYEIELQRAEPIAEDPRERLDQLLSAYAGDDTPGAVIAIVRGGEIIHHQAVGMASLVYDIPFTRETPSNIGSVSKQFTAFSVAKLAVDKIISLEDDVRDYFPSIPDLGHVVTVRQLLNHANGYREFLNLLSMSGLRLGDGDYISRDEILRILENQPALQDEPGTRFNYNNTAYGLAALLVEEVTEQPFNEWLADNVFSPLGMERTRLRSYAGEIIPGAAEGYSGAEKAPYRISVDLGGGGNATMGPGGIYATVDDLAKWLGNMKSGDVGGEAVISEMTRPQIETPGEDSYYGLGVSLSKYRGRDLVSHGGADTAHRAQMWYLPELDAGIIALSNNAAFDGDVVRDVADSFFADELEAEPAENDAEPETPEQEASELAGIDPTPFRRFAGQYELVDFPGVVIVVSADSDGVYIANPGEEPRQVTPISESSVRVDTTQSIDFNVGEDGAVESLTIRGTRELQALKLEDWEPEADALAEYAGRYYSEELGTNYDLAVEDGGLVIHHRRLDDMEMIPKVSDTFNTSGVIVEVKFVRDDQGKLEGFMASNVRTLNVWFEKMD